MKSTETKHTALSLATIKQFLFKKITKHMLLQTYKYVYSSNTTITTAIFDFRVA